jgi:hypothetical protein
MFYLNYFAMHIEVLNLTLFFHVFLTKIKWHLVYYKHLVDVLHSLFKDLVIVRLIHPGSKLNLTDYMFKYNHKTIYRFLDTIEYKLKEDIE